MVISEEEKGEVRRKRKKRGRGGVEEKRRGKGKSGMRERRRVWRVGMGEGIGWV